jgi:hypothetical protein
MLICYRWTSLMHTVDPDTVALYVQRAGGHFEPRVDTVLFWVPERSQTMLVLAWPDLQRRSDLDLI